MRALPLRLHPGDDLRDALGAALAGRLAGRPGPDTFAGDFEILTLAGTLGPDGPHLHMSISDEQGRVTGGHVAPGCTIRTTAEVLVALLPDHAFGRAPDAVTGYAELTIAAR